MPAEDDIKIRWSFWGVNMKKKMVAWLIHGQLQLWFVDFLSEGVQWRAQRRGEQLRGRVVIAGIPPKPDQDDEARAKSRKWHQWTLHCHQKQTVHHTHVTLLRVVLWPFFFFMVLRTPLTGSHSEMFIFNPLNPMGQTTPPHWLKCTMCSFLLLFF